MTNESNATNGQDSAAPAGEQYDRPWLDSLLRPLLIVTMAVCIDVVALAFVREYVTWLSASVRWAILAMGIVVALVGCLTTTWLAHPGQRLRRNDGFRVAEVVLLLLASRLIVWLAQGSFPSLDAMLNRADEVFFDGYFVVTALILLITWLVATDFTDDLIRLALQPDELHLAQMTTRFRDTTRPAQSDRAALLRIFLGRWVAWGVVIIFLAAGLRMGVARAQFWTLAHQDIDLTVVTAIIIYFLVGLLLLSQGRLAALRARWTIDRIPNNASILQNWPLYTTIVLVVLGVVAALLPLGDTLLISVVLSTLLNAVFSLFLFIFQLISLLFMLLLSLLPFSDQTAAPPPTSVPPAAPPPPMESLFEIPAWTGGVLFWTTITLVLVAAAFFYFSDRKGGFVWLRRLAAMVRARWQMLMAGLHRWRPVRTLRSGHSIESVAGPDGRPFWQRWLLRWRDLNPQQQVRYLYFQLLAYAEERAAPRQESETPQRFAPRLSQALDAPAPEEEAIQTITGAFEAVRYADQTIDKEQVSQLQRLWEQLRTTLGSQPPK